MNDIGESHTGSQNQELIFQTEDSVKEHLLHWLIQQGWEAEVSWGRKPGADIVARKGDKTWIIEVKGQGTMPPMRVNFFLAVLGETLQRMTDPNTAYSVAFPDLKQYRNLWERLPLLAKQKTNISALFVDRSGHVTQNTVAGARQDLTSVTLFSPPESSYFDVARVLTATMTRNNFSVLVIPKEYIEDGTSDTVFSKTPLASLFLSGLRWQKIMNLDSVRKCANPIVLTSNPALLGTSQFNPVMGLLPDQKAPQNLITALNYLKLKEPKFASDAKEFIGLGFGWVRKDLVS